jgi:alcohol dehydrogenase
MLPMIGVPTTAGTGSEAQSYALISDDETHTKMACGDQQAMFRIAILDPELTLTQPRRVTAVTGYDAISHAIESGVTRAGNAVSRLHSREAWRLLDANYERVLAEPDNREARGAMQLGAWLAGVAIEGSMLGAAHSCANPLTKNFGTPHGEAIAVVLPHIVRWNGVVAAGLYAELSLPGGDGPDAGAAEVLACRLEELRRAGGLPETLSAVGAQESELEMLADEAASQWTGRFNPRDWSREGAMEIYRQAL